MRQQKNEDRFAWKYRYGSSKVNPDWDARKVFGQREVPGVVVPRQHSHRPGASPAGLPCPNFRGQKVHGRCPVRWSKKKRGNPVWGVPFSPRCQNPKDLTDWPACLQRCPPTTCSFPHGSPTNHLHVQGSGANEWPWNSNKICPGKKNGSSRPRSCQWSGTRWPTQGSRSPR